MQRVTVRKVVRRGRTEWLVDRRENGRRKRTFHPSRRAAEILAADLRGQIADGGAAWFALSSPQRQELMQAWREARKLGLNLAELVRGASRSGEGARGGQRAIGTVIDDLISAKQKAGRAARYTDSLQGMLKQFVKGRETLAVDAFTTADVETFLDGKLIASRSTWRARLSTLFRFAVRRGWRADNPCDKMEPVTHRAPPPAVLKPEQVRLCLAWLVKHPRALGWFVLTTFCGLRPEEAQQTGWEAVRRDCVVVEAQTSKVRQRRVVHPHRTAMVWLRFARRAGAELPINASLRRRTVRALRRVLGMARWPKDLTRHTAASYWLALTQDAAFVAEQLGHSVDVLRKHYKALVSREEAEKAVARLGGNQCSVISNQGSHPMTSQRAVVAS